jgi:hydroxypyruvate isomerase
MKMDRRSALRLLAGSAAAATTLRRLAASDTSAGGFHQSICRWCYGKIPLPQLCEAAKAIGYGSVELLDPPDYAVVREHGLTCAMANGAGKIPDGFNRIENHGWLVKGMIERIKLCAQAGLPNVICFSGNRRGMGDEQGLANCAAGVKQMMAAAEQYKVTVCMELLNSRINHKDYMCDRTAWGVELVRHVGSDRFKLLYDIYHMQIMEGDVIRTIQAHHASIGHYHTGGVPGRHEIDGGQELNYPAIMRAIKATGYTGFVAQEFVPSRDPLTSMREAYQLCNV